MADFEKARSRVRDASPGRPGRGINLHFDSLSNAIRIIFDSDVDGARPLNRNDSPINEEVDWGL